MGKAISVVLVDDNRDFCEILKDYISKHKGIDLIGAVTNGNDAVEFILEKKPDVVLLDIIMPGLDGLGVIEKVKGQGAGINSKFIIMSAIGKQSVTRAALDLGADFYIIKPFGLDTLISRIVQIGSNQEDAPEERLLTTEPNRQIDSVDQLTSKILKDIGIFPNVKGYYYLKDAISAVMVDRNSLELVTKILYPNIATKYKTTAARVERAIRNAIEKAWNSRSEDDNSLLSTLCKCKNKRPTNLELIAIVAEEIKQQVG